MIIKTIRKERGYFPLTEIRVVDGDTLHARINLEFGASIITRIRLKGWWADEPRGAWAESGLAATARLAAWCEGKALWLFSPSGRLDRYGRVVGHLVHHEQIVNPRDVLGDLQLTEKAHQEHRGLGQAQPGSTASSLPPGGVV